MSRLDTDRPAALAASLKSQAEAKAENARQTSPFAVHRSSEPCKECGKADYPTSFTPTSPVKKTMDADGVCFECAFWRVTASKTHETVIDGRIYTIGNRPQGSQHNGMAGRRFDIEYFDGRTVTTYDLWAGGEIPQRHRETIPDTARFQNGAGFVKVGTDGGAWNASSSPRSVA